MKSLLMRGRTDLKACTPSLLLEDLEKQHGHECQEEDEIVKVPSAKVAS